MSKAQEEESKNNGQATKSSVGTNAVLNVLKRFRSRREEAEENRPFDNRLGQASGPLAQRISEISERIEANRTSDAKKTVSDLTVPKAPIKNGDPTVESSVQSGGQTDASANGNDNSHAKQPRTRAMGFHNPVFPAKEPEGAQDPDFSSSTEPPLLKLHDAPDGVMENSGAPEKRLTAPKKKAAQPFDLSAFEEQVRSSMPEPDPEPLIEDEQDGSDGGETAADAEAFRKEFKARIGLAAAAGRIDKLAPEGNPISTDALDRPKSLRLRASTSNSALQNWRNFQSQPPRRLSKDEMTDPENDAGSGNVAHQREEEPASGTGAISSEPPDSGVSEYHDAEISRMEPDFEQNNLALPEDSLPPETTELYSDAIQKPEELLSPTVEPIEPDTATSEAPAPEINENGPMLSDRSQAQEPYFGRDYFSETLDSTDETAAPDEEADSESGPETILHPATADPELAENENEPVDFREPYPENRTEPNADDDPKNVFEALDIDEEEILLKVYDLIQAELQAAWGENITLNIRKIVQKEVRAAIEQLRSEQ